MREIVLVASGGGHLEQLKLLADRLPFSGHRRWITFDTAQSRSLLEGEDVTFTPYVGPRDYRGLIRNLRLSGAVGTRSTTDVVVSTGSGLALAYLPRSSALGIPTHYIESATRVNGPSFTGRLLSRVPGVQVHSQHQGWADDQWTFAGSVFEGFQAVAKPRETGSGTVKKIVVSLGTIRPYGFRRLLDRMVELIGPDLDVTWQTGSTDVAGLPITASAEIPHHELKRLISDADVVVAHAGTGIALTALSAGHCPILVPREAAFGEHVDDHQFQTAELLGKAGLAITRRVSELESGDLNLSLERAVVRGTTVRPLVLDRNRTRSSLVGH